MPPPRPPDVDFMLVQRQAVVLAKLSNAGRAAKRGAHATTPDLGGSRQEMRVDVGGSRQEMRVGVGLARPTPRTLSLRRVGLRVGAV